MTSDTDDDFLDLGYMGDAVNKHVAATALLSGAAEPRLLQSIADPTRRRKAAFRVPAAAGVGSVVPINALQRSVLDSMRHDVEAVQGAQRNAAAVPCRAVHAQRTRLRRACLFASFAAGSARQCETAAVSEWQPTHAQARPAPASPRSSTMCAALRCMFLRASVVRMLPRLRQCFAPARQSSITV
jgi:hypothetical protein